MGLVFATRRTWVDTDQLELILREDAYRRIPLAEAQVGDVIVYTQGDTVPAVHVGVVQRRERDLAVGQWRFEILSQWGADGEYLHDISDVHEALGAPTQAWTDRLD
jgi:hypothetical protein